LHVIFERVTFCRFVASSDTYFPLCMQSHRGRMTIDLYHLYYAVELWCWMAQIANNDALPGIAQTIDRYSS